MRLGSEQFGVAAQSLSSVSHIGPFLDQVPALPRWFNGLTTLGEEEAWVVDLGEYLGLGPTVSVKSRSSLLVVQREGQKIGFVVADLLGTREISGEVLLQVPSPAAIRTNQRFLAGAVEVDDRLLVVLNLVRILSEVEWAKLRSLLTPEKKARRKA